MQVKFHVLMIVITVIGTVQAVEHRSGNFYGNSDVLFRRPWTNCKQCVAADEIRVEAVLCRQTLIEPEERWVDLAIRSAVEGNWKRTTILKWNQCLIKHDHKVYWGEYNSFIVENAGDDGYRKVILPQNKIEQVLNEIHSGLEEGHLGVSKKSRGLDRPAI